MATPSPQPANLSITPIDCWFYPNTDGSSVNYSLPVRKVEISYQPGTMDVSNYATGSVVGMKDGSFRIHGTMTVNGITASLLGGILGMTSSDNGLDIMHEDDVTISSGSGTLSETVNGRSIYVQDENGKYLDWQASGTPTLGYYTASGTDLTVASSVDGVNYTAKYLVADSSSTDSDRYALDLTHEQQRTFAMYIAGLTIDTTDGEPFFDSSDSDKLSVNGVYIAKAHFNSDLPLFVAGREEHEFDLEFDAWITTASDFYRYLVCLTSSPTS